MRNVFTARCIAARCIAAVFLVFACTAFCAAKPAGPPNGLPAFYAPLQLKMDTSKLDSAGLSAEKKQAVMEWSKNAEEAVHKWYPRIVETLGDINAPALSPITIVLDPAYKGVAATGGDTITVSPAYVADHPNDVGMIVHEMVHVAQHYPRYDPVWLVEGIADYVRFYAYEPVSARPHPAPARVTYHDSYRTTASFLDFVARKHNSRIVQRLDAALRADTYSPAIWKKETGRDLETLDKEWKTALAAYQK